MDIKTILIVGLIFLCIGTASAATTTVEPLSGFNPIVDVSEDVIPGNEYWATFEFTANYDTTIVINFSVEHPEIGSDEWFVTIIFNETSFSDEIAPGVFSTGEVEINKGYHLIGVQYRPHIAVLPDNYNLTLEILSEDVVIETTRRRGGGGGSGGVLPTPTPNATAEPGDGGIPVAMATSVPVTFTVGQEPSEPPEPRNYLYGMNVVILIILNLLMLRGWVIER